MKRRRVSEKVRKKPQRKFNLAKQNENEKKLKKIRKKLRQTPQNTCYAMYLNGNGDKYTD